MKKGFLMILFFTITLCFFFGCDQQLKDSPPVAKIDNVIDEYYGVKVDDPYRYMEDMDDPEVQNWFKEQAEYAADILENLPGRNELYERLKELDAGKPFSLYRIRRLTDGTLFYMKRKSDENIAKLYVRKENSGKETILVDPEKITTTDDQHYAIGNYTPSPTGRYVVYGLAQGGSEETILHVLDLQSGENLSETIDRIETAYNRPRWMPDESGFFYSRRQELPADAPETEIYKKTKVYFHELGTQSEDDQLIMGYGVSERVALEEVDFPSIYIPGGSKYAVAKIKHGDSNPLTIYTAPITDLLKKEIPWAKVCDVEDEVIDYAVNRNEIFLQTSKNAPRFKVVRTSLVNPKFSNAQDVIKTSDQVIEMIVAAKDALYAGTMDGGFNQIVRLGYGKGENPEQLKIPDNAAGYIVSVSQGLDGILVYTNSWTKGSVIYEYDRDSKEFTNSELMPKGKFDDLPGYISAEVKVESHDGVMVPLSIIHKSDIELDGNNPALVVGYGAYGISENVFFNPLNIAWMERGGVYAVAHVRGGGEYGKEWHHAGQKSTKPNTWKDLIACAEYLIKEGYTSKKLIAGQGGSAGGIMIGRAITERPDLFAAVLINVGDLDAVRFETTTNGVPNIPEFGTVKIEEEFHALYEMSSYHKVVDGENYPAVLLSHGINDPRVEPWMSAKMTARLQTATTSGKPILFRVDYSGGHGIGSTRSQYLEGLADRWAFLFWQFGVDI